MVTSRAVNKTTAVTTVDDSSYGSSGNAVFPMMIERLSNGYSVSAYRCRGSVVRLG